jgi:cytochrome oxidase Cu insertion factor (SCO1/SenC/PrrC family)
MTSERSIGVLLTVGLLAVLVIHILEGHQTPASTRTPIDLSKLGPQVGQRVPDFALKDQDGKQWTRQSIMGPKGAMLVFVRSADW